MIGHCSSPYTMQLARYILSFIIPSLSNSTIYGFSSSSFLRKFLGFLTTSSYICLYINISLCKFLYSYFNSLSHF